MNYFEYHLGDYAKDAGHLSMLKDGAYLRLMAVYYGREKPLPLDLKECFELTRCASKAEREAVLYLLERFFRKDTDGYHQKRCDEEIARFKAKSEAGKTGANARWAHKRNGCDGIAIASNPHDVRNALQSPVSSPQEFPTPNPFPPSGEGASARETGSNPRAVGTNPRANGTHPRASGTNPRAERDERKSGWTEATEVWTQLLASEGAKPQRTGRIQAALDAIGGWQAVRVRSDFDEPRLRRQFCESYAGATS